jgi:hypothetical protein
MCSLRARAAEIGPRLAIVQRRRANPIYEAMMEHFAKSMTFLALLALVSVACTQTDKSDELKRKIDEINHQSDIDVAAMIKDLDFSNILARKLSPPSADGISHNEFTIDLKKKSKVVKLEYLFDPANFKTMNAELPTVAFIGCTEVEVEQDQTNADKPYIYRHGSGNILGFNATATPFTSEFGKDVDIDAKATDQQLLSISINIEESCTRITGKFDVQFR